METIQLLKPKKFKCKYTEKKTFTCETFYLFKIKKNFKVGQHDDITLNYLNNSYTFSIHENSKVIVMPSANKKFPGRRELIEYTQEIQGNINGTLSIRIDKHTKKLKYIVVKIDDLRIKSSN